MKKKLKKKLKKELSTISGHTKSRSEGVAEISSRSLHDQIRGNVQQWDVWLGTLPPT